jgi:hypothetical protein
MTYLARNTVKYISFWKYAVSYRKFAYWKYAVSYRKFTYFFAKFIEGSPEWRPVQCGIIFFYTEE